MNQIDYTIGDEIVCINNKSMVNKYKKPSLILNNVYKAYSLILCPCGCKNILVDVNLPKDNIRVYCYNSNKLISTNIRYVSASRFKKLDNLVNISELTEILEQPIEQQY